MPVMRIRTSGVPTADVDGGPSPQELLWRKHLALLLYLGLSPRRTRSREHLIGLFWGDKPDAAARHSLNEAVRLVRRHLGETALTTGGSGVTLAADAVVLDEEGDGVFLDGFTVPNCPAFDDWLAAERLGRARRGVDELVAHAERRLAAGDPTGATELAERAVALDATSEPAVRALMRSLALSGHGALALAAFDALAERLQEGWGAEPDPETRGLAERIRNGTAGPRRAARVPAPSPTSRPPLVGRAAELTGIIEGIAEAQRNVHPMLILVEGESGSGKTRLLEEAAARARLSGYTIALTRPTPAERMEPWATLGGLARGGLMDAPGVVGARPDALAALAQVDAEWALRVGATASGSPAPALTEVMRAIAEESPLLIIVDDAQWADDESIGALFAGLRDAGNAALCAVVGLRAAAGSVIDELRTRIGREIRGTVVKLGALDAQAVQALADAMLPDLGGGGRDRLVRRVQADSAGIPLLAAEILRALAHGLDLGRLERSWPAPGRTLDDTSPAELPDAVVASVRINYRRLSDDAQLVLACAATLGARSTEDAIGRATGLGTERLEAALDDLEWQRWLVVDGRGYAFTARLVRDIVARDFLTPGQRDRILRRAGVGGPGSA